MNHEQWLENKKTYIGGSEAAAILGVSKYSSALSVYLNKIGKGMEVEDSEQMYFGRLLEETVINEYTRRTGIPTTHNKTYDVFHYNEFIACTPDAMAVCPRRGPGVIEAKTASEYVSSEWEGDSSPEAYIIQLYHNMACCGVKWGAIPVLIGGNKFKYREYEWDEELISIIFEKEKDFWFNNVLKRIPPDPTGASLEVLGKLYPKDNGSLIHINNGIGKDIINWLTCRDRIKELEDRKDESAAKIQAIMGEAQKGIYQAEDNTIFGVSWSHVNGRVLFDAKAFEKDNPELYQKYCRVGNGYRRFNVTKKVGKLTTEERLMIEGGIA